MGFYKLVKKELSEQFSLTVKLYMYAVQKLVDEDQVLKDDQGLLRLVAKT
jgi:hypothetical protein